MKENQFFFTWNRETIFCLASTAINELIIQTIQTMLEWMEFVFVCVSVMSCFVVLHKGFPKYNYDKCKVAAIL